MFPAPLSCVKGKYRNPGMLADDQEIKKLHCSIKASRVNGPFLKIL